MFGKENTLDPIELEKSVLAEEWSKEEVDSERRQELIQRWIALDNQQLEHKKLKAAGSIDMKTWFQGGLTLTLALLTLNFEKTDVLRSKVQALWLKRSKQ